MVIVIIQPRSIISMFEEIYHGCARLSSVWGRYITNDVVHEENFYNCIKIWKILSKNAVKEMSGQLKLGLGGHQEGRQKTLLSCILSLTAIHIEAVLSNIMKMIQGCVCMDWLLPFIHWISSANTVQVGHEERHCCRVKWGIAVCIIRVS